ncbi:MAG: hypothetical protein SO401_03295 [Blautia sp.]|nr:hypothetical protein [Blautia sp.]
MKKRYLILTALCVFIIAAAGCGKKKEAETAPIQVTATPAPEVTQQADLVNMQQSADDAGIKDVMGEKTADSSRVVFVNKTGADIASVYVRAHVSNDEDEEEDSWGSDLINGMFTLADKGKALYYFQKNTGNNNGGTVSSYDIRITYTDEDRNECFFRNIPLQSVTQISLCMDGTGEDSIPYAVYTTGNNTKQYSTLNDVKKRLGLTDDSSENDSSEYDGSVDNDSSSQITPTPSSDNNSQENSTNGNKNTGDNDSDTSSSENTDQGDENMISTAESYIGQSLDALEDACGSPQGSEYENDPETGQTGFHYYSNFTVSTSVDENGNEIVAGVW